MNSFFCRLATLAVVITFAVAPTLHAQAWLPPTPEELSLTSVPEAPGAAAIILYHEETTEDALRMFSFYTRIKVLTEAGKDEANVELPSGGKVDVHLDSISARTIHADGTIIPFTGKPYDKVVEKIGGYKYKARVFSLPAVEVGSIIEYRYKFHYDDSYFMEPEWYIQSKLFMRTGHYLWKPNQSYQRISDSRGNDLDRVAWTPILPAGVKVEQKKVGGVNTLELNISNIKPLPKEEFMPPVDSFSYRVQFYYTSYANATEFWNKEGKRWSKMHDSFVGPNKGVKEAVSALVSPGDSQDVKLHKIYAAVEAMENTDFTRERSAEEEHAAGLKPASSSDDILARKRGDGDQLALLFVAMARAAGMKAYVMGVANRNERIFFAQYLSLYQLDDDIAIVNVDGKDVYFDPGQRYCEYGHLAWKHTLSGGLRQTDGGNTDIVTTPGPFYKDESTKRIADLTLDEHGVASGAVILTYTGNPALRWRQAALRGDSTSLNSDLKEHLEQMLPGGVEVTVGTIDNLTDSTKPLKVTYQIKGAIGSPTGKRLLVPANLFETNSKPKFPQATRELAIDMHYAQAMNDAVRFKLPPGLAIESTPATEITKMGDVAAFNTTTARSGDAITLYRNLVVGKTFFTVAEYNDLRGFYGKIEAKDQETLILTHATETATKSGGSN